MLSEPRTTALEAPHAPDVTSDGSEQKEVPLDSDGTCVSRPAWLRAKAWALGQRSLALPLGVRGSRERASAFSPRTRASRAATSVWEISRKNLPVKASYFMRYTHGT